MLIRPATGDDGPQCLELIEALTGVAPTDAWPAVFGALVGGERGAVLVAEHNDRIVGCVTVSYNLAVRYGGEYCQLEELMVDESARGLNLGRLLMERAIDDARARGCAEMGLYLAPGREGNQGFYEKLGFAVVGTEMRQALR